MIHLRFSESMMAEGEFDVLSELGRKTTAYHEAPIDRVEYARQEYLDALRHFNEAQGEKTSSSGA